MSELAYKLLAIVAVERAKGVFCQQPHCGHRVYARIHVVEEGGMLLLLGSDCFATRYGVANTTGFKGFGGGAGRVLTDVERELLLSNTAALLAQFEAERAQDLERMAAKLEFLRRIQAAKHQEPPETSYRSLPDPRQHFHARHAPPVARPAPATAPPQLQPHAFAAPLPSWAALKKPNTAFFAYGVGEGQCWVLMQSASHDGCFIAPAPVPFVAWDEALPPSIGIAEAERNIYVSQRSVALK